MTLQFGKTYWGWATHKAGMASGNYESRDEALGAARRLMGPEYTGEIWLVSGECPVPLDERDLDDLDMIYPADFGHRFRDFLRANNVTHTRWVPKGEPELVRPTEKVRMRIQENGNVRVMSTCTSTWHVGTFNGENWHSSPPSEPHKSRAEKVWVKEQRRRGVVENAERLAREIEELCK